MKRCWSCKQTKPLVEFNKNRVAKDGLQRRCRECDRAFALKAYKANPERIARNRVASIERAREHVWQWLIEHPCIDCGEDDPIVLEFDHVDLVKEFNIAAMVCDGYGIRRIAAEIAKCVVRCANCHRRKTAEAGQHWRTKRIAQSPAA